MPATPPEGLSDSAPGSSPQSAEARRHSRYNFLVGRLRSRQITMEEATELFALMETMLRASEAARRVAAVASGRPGPAAAPAARPTTPVAAAAPSSSDDLFLVGLLAMGAGAGMLAAMSRRLAEGPLPGSAPDRRAGDRRSS